MLAIFHGIDGAWACAHFRDRRSAASLLARRRARWPFFALAWRLISEKSLAADNQCVAISASSSSRPWHGQYAPRPIGVGYGILKRKPRAPLREGAHARPTYRTVVSEICHHHAPRRLASSISGRNLGMKYLSNAPAPPRLARHGASATKLCKHSPARVGAGPGWLSRRKRAGVKPEGKSSIRSGIMSSRCWRRAKGGMRSGDRRIIRVNGGMCVALYVYICISWYWALYRRARGAQLARGICNG